MNALPIRIRLTLWYSLAMAATMFVIGFVSLWMVHRAIDDIEKSELHQRARSVQRFLESRPANESFDQLRGEITAALYPIHGNKWLQVIDEHGNWLYRSPHVVAIYPNLVLPQLANQGGCYFSYTADSLHVRALIEPIAVHGVRYTVQTGLTLTEAQIVLSNFRIHLFLLIVVGLVVSSFAGHFMSRKALRPVAVLAAEARRINDRHLDIRLPVTAAKDELSDLSRTLNQMLERIDKAFASVRNFTGNASHELRTPLSLLRTEIEVALYRPREVAEHEAILHRLQEQSVRMTGLLENLLSLARADGGAEAIALSPIQLTQLFRQIEQAWRGPLEKALLDFHVELPVGDHTLLGDLPSIVRLLSVLLENASKYTPPGGSVTLRAAVAEEHIILAVRDTGIGIVPEDMLHIFDRFFRASSADNNEAGGSGLGLALAKWIAGRHNTELSVNSEPGQGSSFSFSLQLICLPEREKASGSPLLAVD